MKTSNFNKFNNIYDNYINGNTEEYKEQLKRLNKVNLIRFNNWLKYYPLNRNLHVDVNLYGGLIICE